MIEIKPKVWSKIEDFKFNINDLTIVQQTNPIYVKHLCGLNSSELGISPYVNLLYSNLAFHVLMYFKLYDLKQRFFSKVLWFNATNVIFVKHVYICT